MFSVSWKDILKSLQDMTSSVEQPQVSISTTGGDERGNAYTKAVGFSIASYYAEKV